MGWWNEPFLSDEEYPFECERCEDQGCFECCPPEPVTLDDIITIDDDIAAYEQQKVNHDQTNR